jgi:hypothetical protein
MGGRWRRFTTATRRGGGPLGQGCDRIDDAVPHLVVDDTGGGAGGGFDFLNDLYSSQSGNLARMSADRPET